MLAWLICLAERTIDEMPIEPYARIWQILLSACCLHVNFDTGSVAVRKHFEQQPDNESDYIFLSDLCASTGMRNAVRKLRRVIKKSYFARNLVLVGFKYEDPCITFRMMTCCA
ncbi:hypothetical protein V6N13_036296 [Hibiscus sabdariffa]|uniref:Uncharacterized protein n=1 Tax=Hibiscus sabdariffa TaxID=183260 RepID=A0ABR2S6T4_9ROSI